MAKKFLGFTPDQQFTLLSKMGYGGPKEGPAMEQFLASNPAAASKLGDYTKKAQERIMKRNFALGGVVAPNNQTWLQQNRKKKNTPATTTTTPTTTTAPPAGTPTQLDQTALTGATQQTQQQATTSQQSSLNAAQQRLAELQRQAAANPTDQVILYQMQQAQQALTQAQSSFNLAGVPGGNELLGQATQNPASLVTQAQVATMTEQANQIIDPDTGQVQQRPDAQTSTVSETAQAQAPATTAANTVEAATVTPAMEQALAGAEAAQGGPSKAATVQGQLEGLMAQFEGGATPPWASGAMRQAMAVMQQRGLGASSMAGQAVVQAAMESAIAIASQDANINAQFEMQNLDNRQQTMIFKTQQRISGLLSDQAQENASRQFNASSRNQTDQFFAGLQESVSRFNADQINAIRQFNTGQTNAGEQFNAQINAQRDQFNAQNSLIIAQANAQWRQNISTINTAAQNEANMEAARAATQMTQLGMDQLWQRERDLMAFAFTSYESSLERETQLLLGNKTVEIARMEQAAADRAGIGSIVGSVVRGLFG